MRDGIGFCFMRQWFSLVFICTVFPVLPGMLGCNGNGSQNVSSSETPPALHQTSSANRTKDVFETGRKFADDAAFRRRILKNSLVNHKNGYAKVRLANYTPEKWGQLKVLTPRYRRVRPEDLGAEIPTVDESWETLDVDNVHWQQREIMALGEKMFTSYPAQLDQALYHIVTGRGEPDDYGFWETSDWVGGLIWVALPGGVYPSFSCASCHANVNDQKKLVYGLPNHNINIGKLKDDNGYRHTHLSQWGNGKADISADGIDNPISIADLRAVRFQTHLHRTANIRNSVAALAARLDTGLILASRRSVRPPPMAAFALAYFVTELGTALTPVPELSGRDVFNKQCARCHNGDGFSGKPVPIDEVHSNEHIARSPDRTTGFMQNTSLRGVSDRKNLLSDGRIHSFEELLQKNRNEHGHYFGLDLSRDEKKKLIRFLKKL